jgi:hypothetical protein
MNERGIMQTINGSFKPKQVPNKNKFKKKNQFVQLNFINLEINENQIR